MSIIFQNDQTKDTLQSNSKPTKVSKSTKREQYDTELNTLRNMIKTIKQKLRLYKTKLRRRKDSHTPTSRSDNRYDEIYNSECSSSSMLYSNENNSAKYFDSFDSRSTIILSHKERSQLRRFSQEMISWKQQNSSFASTASKTSSHNNDSSDDHSTSAIALLTYQTDDTAKTIVNTEPKLISKAQNVSTKSVTNTLATTTVPSAKFATTITNSKRTKSDVNTEYYQVKGGLYGGYLIHS